LLRPGRDELGDAQLLGSEVVDGRGVALARALARGVELAAGALCPQDRADALERLERRAQLRPRLDLAPLAAQALSVGELRRACSNGGVSRACSSSASWNSDSASSPSASIARHRARTPCTKRARLIGAHAAKRSSCGRGALGLAGAQRRVDHVRDRHRSRPAGPA
jgi:hypothetical protein